MRYSVLGIVSPIHIYQFAGLENGVLLGDSGYPCRTFLLTPYLNATNAVQERYNDSHSKTRCCIERLFGVWKRRFHILHAEVWAICSLLYAYIFYSIHIMVLTLTTPCPGADPGFLVKRGGDIKRLVEGPRF